jgi:hypothetical protein
MAQISKNASPEEVFKNFEKSVSRYRLRRYRQGTATKEEAVALYLWNIRLCEALYPAVQFFEVALRNSTHDALSELRRSGDQHNPRWFMDFSLLGPSQQGQVLQALETLKRTKPHTLGLETDANYPREPQRIVAELSLGFWVSLYSNFYTHSVVVPIVANVFPNGPREIVRDRRQDFISPRLREVQDLRNRIFHHEPIYHWSLLTNDQALLARYERLIELLGWMDATQPAFLHPIDRFKQVHNAGWKALLDEAEFTFLEVTEAAS